MLKKEIQNCFTWLVNEVSQTVIYNWSGTCIIYNIGVPARYVLYLRDCFDNHDIFYPDNV